MKTIDNIYDAMQQNASKRIFMEVQIVYAGLVKDIFSHIFFITSWLLVFEFGDTALMSEEETVKSSSRD